MNIALLGFGTVGSHFYKLCEGRTDLHVAAVLSRRPRPELTCTVTADYDEIVRDPSIDIVVEVMGGIESAYSYLCAAMRAGKHVVTANKQLMCAHFEELTSLAKEKGVALRCTAAAGGGIPWLTSLSRASELDEIKAVEGILNSAPEAHTDGTGNLVTLFASRFGKQSFSGAGAGGYPTGSNVLRDCLDVADGCRSFYADSFTPCSVNLSGTQCKWLFRCMGEYFTRECSARAAFDAYESYRKDDPHALLARYAAEEE